MARGNGFQASANSLLFGARSKPKTDENGAVVYTEADIRNWAAANPKQFATYVLDDNALAVIAAMEAKYNGKMVELFENQEGVFVSIQSGNKIHEEVIKGSNLFAYKTDNIIEDIAYELDAIYEAKNA